MANQKQEPAPLPYLQDKKLTAYNIKLSVSIQVGTGRRKEKKERHRSELILVGMW